MTKYTPDTIQKIETLISTQNQPVNEICKKLKITPETYKRWQDTHPEFAQKIKTAKHNYDQHIASIAEKSLIKRLKGYYIKEVKQEQNETGDKTTNKTTITKKYIAPDTSTIIFALTNKVPDKYRNKPNPDKQPETVQYDNIEIEIINPESTK